jgi:phosphohistidine phosphatase
MKILLILRHAKSSWKYPELADHDRPLKKRGKRDAPRMGRLIEAEGLIPDKIISSTARRARDTAEAVAETCNYNGEIEFRREFYFSGYESFLTMLGELPDMNQTVMVVGHNPDLEELLDTLTGQYERLPTAALAQIKLPIHNWRDLDDDVKGELLNLWYPRELK